MSTRICPDCEVTTELDICPKCGCPTLDQTPFLKREDPLVGKLVAGRFRVQGILGVGGMGKVYVAEQVAMKRQVALKVIRTQESGDISQKMSLYKRFQREAMAASRLEHPNTVRVYDFGMAEDGTLFLAMELLRGTTFSKILQSGPLPRRRLVKIAIQICRSLAEAHQNGIVHRDLKPDNIMISDVAGDRDFVKILDFGIAKITAETGQSSITRTGMIMGTPAYMAPEQATAKNVGPATDLYALGVILYEAVSGRPPFGGETPLAILIKHANEVVPRLVVDGLPPDVPEDLAKLIYDLLEKKPAGRPSSAIEVARRLESIDFQKLVQGEPEKVESTKPGIPVGLVSMPVAAPARPPFKPVADPVAGAVSGPKAGPVVRPIASQSANPAAGPAAAAVAVPMAAADREDKVITTLSLPNPADGTGYVDSPDDGAMVFGARRSGDVGAAPLPVSPVQAESSPDRQKTPSFTDDEIVVAPRRGRIWIVLVVALILAGASGAALWAIGGADETSEQAGVAGTGSVDESAQTAQSSTAAPAPDVVVPAPQPAVVGPLKVDSPKVVMPTVAAPNVAAPVTGVAKTEPPVAAPVSQTVVKPAPVSPAAVTPAPARRPATATTPVQPRAKTPAAKPAQVPATVAKPAQVPATVTTPAPVEKKPQPALQLPRCIRSNCPISGDCADWDGRRVNGENFCGDINW